MRLAKHAFTLTPLCALLTALPAMATNGMLMEGYGPISTGMGGASQAFDHGTAAMAQNPATLALGSGAPRLDLALGLLGPRVASAMPGMPDAASSGTAYAMPAIGYTARSGALTYGIGMFAHGGMGTEYGANTFLAAGSGQAVRSELSVGNVIVPLAWQVSPTVTVGGSLDYLWAGMDMLMAASPQQLGAMVTGGDGNLGGALGSGALNSATWARINFSDDGKFTGAARATSFGMKLGATFKLNPDLTLGLSYRTKTRLSDMQTGASEASMTANPGAAATATFSDKGRISVLDFQMPAVLSLGASWQLNPALQVAADLKSVAWSGVMKDFRLRYESAGMGGSVSFALPQNWKDQTVLNLGVAYKASETLTLRGGVNLADNPIPESFVNPLFPATVQQHYTLGLGLKLTPSAEFNAAFTYAPDTTVNANGMRISHGQTNWQLMFTQRF